jgi:hypothetical protein
MQANRVSRCSHCGHANHNIRTCAEYIAFIHEKLIRVYINNQPNRFPRQLDSFRLLPYLNAITRHSNLPPYTYPMDNEIELSGHLLMLHRHYLQLAANVLDAEPLLGPDVVIPIPAPVQAVGVPAEQPNRYNTPPRQRFNQQVNAAPPAVRNPAVRVRTFERVSPEELYQHRVHYEQAIHEMANLIREIDLEFDIRYFESRPAIQMHNDPSKFPNGDATGECPVCYENCENMVATGCAHFFCQPCMNTMINNCNQKLPCAMCRTTVKDLYMHNEESLDNMMRI